MILPNAKRNNKIILVDTWSPVYTPLYCISHVVFICFMSSLICAHAATDSDSSSMCTIILFPVLMSNIHFRFFLILLVSFVVISHYWGWYNSTKVYHPKLHQLGKQFDKLFCFWFGNNYFGLGNFQFWGVRNLFLVIFLWVWHWWVWSFALELRDVNNSCTLVCPCFHLFWFGLHLLFLALSPILALGLAIMGLPSFLASWTTVDVTSSPWR